MTSQGHPVGGTEAHPTWRVGGDVQCQAVGSVARPVISGGAPVGHQIRSSNLKCVRGGSEARSFSARLICWGLALGV